MDDRTKRMTSGRRCLALLTVFLLIVGSAGLSAVAQVYSREALIEDAWQLLAIIEETHVDPYPRGGGKVSFCGRSSPELATRTPRSGLSTT
jgi:hypothetical protein